MVVAWLVFPLVLLAVCLGCGLLVERLSGWTLPVALLPSVGLATVIVIATLPTQKSASASATTLIVVLVALAGYATALVSVSGSVRIRRWLDGRRPEAGVLLVGLGVFAACAAPVVLSGNATFLGYFVDNDSSFHFALIDQLLSRGQDLAGIPTSSYASALHEYLGS